MQATIQDDPADVFSDALMRLLQIARSSEVFTATGMSKVQLAILAALKNNSPCRLTNLAETINTDLSTLSRQITGLSERQLIAKVRDPDDRRAWQLTPTNQGRSCLQEARLRQRAWFARQLGEFPLADQWAAARILSAVAKQWMLCATPKSPAPAPSSPRRQPLSF